LWSEEVVLVPTGGVKIVEKDVRCREMVEQEVPEAAGHTTAFGIQMLRSLVGKVDFAAHGNLHWRE
jgi:hypothetical protein